MSSFFVEGDIKKIACISESRILEKVVMDSIRLPDSSSDQDVRTKEKVDCGDVDYIKKTILHELMVTNEKSK